MAPKLFRVLLPVSEIERAVAFYRAVLQVEGVRVSNGRHYFDLGGTILACFDPRTDGDEYDARANPEYIYIAVTDLERTHDRCREAGATFAAEDVHGAAAGEIATRPWGERSFYIRDPFDNPICFVDADTMFTGK